MVIWKPKINPFPPSRVFWMIANLAGYGLALARKGTRKLAPIYAAFQMRSCWMSKLTAHQPTKLR